MNTKEELDKLRRLYANRVASLDETMRERDLLLADIAELQAAPKRQKLIHFAVPPHQTMKVPSADSPTPDWSMSITAGERVLFVTVEAES